MVSKERTLQHVVVASKADEIFQGEEEHEETVEGRPAASPLQAPHPVSPRRRQKAFTRKNG